MKYYDGYKYQLAEDEVFKTGITGYGIDTKFIRLEEDGTLTVREDYAWDGPSGPTIDRKTNMRGALAHDALYQLIREGFLPMPVRDNADDFLLRCWIEDGMWGWLARIEVQNVRWFGKSSAKWESEHCIKVAP